MTASTSHRTPLYLEDLSVGQIFVTESTRIETDQIKAFAGQFDPQPFHLDEVAAQSSLFGGLAASGWHTAALTMRLMVESGLPVAGGLIGAGVELNWPAPTRPGDELHVETEILEIIPSRSRPDRGIVRVGNRTINQNGDAVQVMVSKMVVPRRPQ